MRFLLSALFFLLLAGNALALDQAEALALLEDLAPIHLEKISRNLRPSQSHKAVLPEGNGFVAVYLEVDMRRPEVEVAQTAKPGEYVGRLSYVVHEYRAHGKTEAQALEGPFRKARSRRMREYASFIGGKWAL